MVFWLSKRLLCTFVHRYVYRPTYMTHFMYIFKVKLLRFVNVKLTRIRIRMDPHWFGSLNLDSH
jgi:hypothetical protein